MCKPVGSRCNLACDYCYYLDKSGDVPFPELMPRTLLEEYIRQYIADCGTDEVEFCWHGGEPLLAGLDFFRDALALEQRYSEGRHIANSLQTNATLLSDEWCSFLAQNQFLVGISIDGAEELHDAHRHTSVGRGTWAQVMRGIDLLKKYGVPFNTLSVVSDLSRGRAVETYRFLRDEVGSRHMQFLPAVEYVLPQTSGRPRIVAPDTAGSVPAPWSITAEDYGEFLCGVFDEWVVRDVGSVFVQLFDATLARWSGRQADLCTLCDTCGQNLVVEHNGEVYSCDHFVYSAYRLGNLSEDRLGAMARSKFQRQFGIAKRNTLPEDCIHCAYLFACAGECPKHRFERDAEGYLHNALCKGLYRWFSHAEPYMERMARLLAEGRAPQDVMTFAREELRK